MAGTGAGGRGMTNSVVRSRGAEGGVSVLPKRSDHRYHHEKSAFIGIRPKLIPSQARSVMLALTGVSCAALTCWRRSGKDGKLQCPSIYPGINVLGRELVIDGVVLPLPRRHRPKCCHHKIDGSVVSRGRNPRPSLSPSAIIALPCLSIVGFVEFIQRCL